MFCASTLSMARIRDSNIVPELRLFSFIVVPCRCYPEARN